MKDIKDHFFFFFW